MLMKKKLAIVLTTLIVATSLFGASYHSVPLNHRAYFIIDAAEQRGLIDRQMDVRPYSVEQVLSLFSEIEKGRVSAEERKEIDAVREELAMAYGAKKSTATGTVLRNGFFRTSGDDGANTFAIGVSLTARGTFGASTADTFAYDVRTAATAYLRGNLWDVFSFDMNMSGGLEKLDPSVFLFNDFRFDDDGFSFLSADIPSSQFQAALYARPELSMGLFENKLRIRFGTIQRDWGPGVNNLSLSASAQTFPAIEAQVDITNWLRFSVLTGSLEKFLFSSDYDGRPWPSNYRTTDKSDYKYDNNFSIQRVEWSPTKDLTLSIFESVVWKKRFELAYLNPVGIYMFDQNALGDLDNVLAGFDASYRWKGVGTLYAAAVADEFDSASLKKLLTYTRNIIGLQGGMILSVPWGDFSTFMVQATYLSPFLYSHYATDDNPWNAMVNTSYVNKGFNLGYPMDPDSLELLMRYETGFGNGWTGQVTVKHQMRSAQYATNTEYGTTVLTVIDYDNNDGYAPKQFFSYIWSHVLDVELTLAKRLSAFPVEFTGGLRFEADWTREYTVTTVESASLNYGKTVMGSWNSPTFGVYGTFGVKVFY